MVDRTGDGVRVLENAHDVATDSIGNVYVTGFGSHNAFQITPGGAITEIFRRMGLREPSAIA